jgi:3-oxoacyl-[acyl-carrier protein] reductase
MTILSGKIALVTGGNRGIGAACSVALARAGCDVAVNYHQRGEDAERVRAEIEKLGRRAIAVQADVSSADQVNEMAVAVEKQLGPVSVLINNAGMMRVRKVEEITEADFDEHLRINLKSAFLVTQAVLPKMREQRWGRLVFMSSVAAQVGGLVGPHYAASKAGMLGLMHGYASTLAKEGVTSNAICPALIETDMVRANPRATPEVIPVGRFGTSDEVASAVVMLAENAYVTGQSINVNGGWYLS